jgi:hypothetical protein
MNRKPSLEDCVDAIIARDSGMPYSEVIEAFDITPNQFALAVTRDLANYIRLTRGNIQSTLREISKDDARLIDLFNMGEEFVRGQYDAILADEQAILYYGTCMHPENRAALAYHALVLHNPKMGSRNRRTVIKAIEALPSRLEKYMHSIKLGGLMSSSLNGSPLGVLECFDRDYQRKTGDSSLFDLSQRYHIHKWGEHIKAPQSYWHDPANAGDAIYHVLTENRPSLASNDRKKVIKSLKRMPSKLKEYFYAIGLSGIMVNAFEEGHRDSPSAVLEFFDLEYQKRTGDKSLFDLTQPQHLHRWGDKFCAPRCYWQNPANVREAVYHTLIEARPKLASEDRTSVIQAVRELPDNLRMYMYSLGLGGLMGRAFRKTKRDSPKAILMVFDKEYRARTGNQSLFDKTQTDYLEFDGKNRLKRDS